MRASGDGDAALHIGNAVVSYVRRDSDPQRSVPWLSGMRRIGCGLEIGRAKSLAYKGLRLAQNARVKVVAKHRMMVRPKSCIWGRPKWMIDEIEGRPRCWSVNRSALQDVCRRLERRAG